MAFGLHRLLRQLQISAKRSISSQNSTIKPPSDVFIKSSVTHFASKNNIGAPQWVSDVFVRFTPRSIDIVKDFPSGGRNGFNIIKCPLIRTNLEIVEPPKSISIEKVEDFPRAAIELPGLNEHEEKQAARLLIIRKNKMKTHKLKKLRKKMKFEWAKRRQKREMRKEKVFQAELLAQIKKAENFNAVNYVAEKIRKATEVPIPRFWRGKRLPEFIIRQKLGLDKK